MNVMPCLFPYLLINRANSCVPEFSVFALTEHYRHGPVNSKGKDQEAKKRLTVEFLLIVEFHVQPPYYKNNGGIDHGVKPETVDLEILDETPEQFNTH
jgi:hypothetical protein